MVSLKVFNRKFRKFLHFRENIYIKQGKLHFSNPILGYSASKIQYLFFSKFQDEFFLPVSNSFFLKKPQKCSKIFEANIKMHFIYEFFEAENFRNSVFHKKSILNTIFGSVDFKFLFKKKSFDPKPENLYKNCKLY